MYIMLADIVSAHVNPIDATGAPRRPVDHVLVLTAPYNPTTGSRDSVGVEITATTVTAPAGWLVSTDVILATRRLFGLVGKA